MTKMPTRKNDDKYYSWLNGVLDADSFKERILSELHQTTETACKEKDETKCPTTVELASLLASTKSRVWAALSVLHAKGYVKNFPCPKNARSVRWAIPPEDLKKK